MPENSDSGNYNRLFHEYFQLFGGSAGLAGAHDPGLHAAFLVAAYGGDDLAKRALAPRVVQYALALHIAGCQRMAVFHENHKRAAVAALE